MAVFTCHVHNNSIYYYLGIWTHFLLKIKGVYGKRIGKIRRPKPPTESGIDIMNSSLIT